MNTPQVGRSKRAKARKAVLVYQAGIANVFTVDCFNLNPYGREAQRIMQSDFRTCESFARGLAFAGFTVQSLACNQAGDIVDAQWSDNLDEQPFSDKFNPVVSRDGNLLPRSFIMDKPPALQSA